MSKSFLLLFFKKEDLPECGVQRQVGPLKIPICEKEKPGRALALTKKRSISFLKKRNKKLLLFAPSRRFKWANQVLPLIGKSFLVLFSKKNCYLPYANASRTFMTIASNAAASS
jgi:hypothetical protein